MNPVTIFMVVMALIVFSIAWALLDDTGTPHRYSGNRDRSATGGGTDTSSSGDSSSDSSGSFDGGGSDGGSGGGDGGGGGGGGE